MPSSAASIGTLWAVTEVLSLVDQGHATIDCATTQAVAPKEYVYKHRISGLTLIDLRQKPSNLIDAVFGAMRSTFHCWRTGSSTPSTGWKTVALACLPQ